MRALITTLVAVLLCVTGCERPKQPERTTEAAAAPNGDLIAAAINDPQRLVGDSAEDEWRNPAAVLKFVDVHPGMRVIDYFAAGGYYTELLARIVGATGQVIAYNNPAYQKFAATKPQQRYGHNRLPNVVQLTAPPEELPVEPASVDAAVFIDCYHDLYWHPEDGSWTPTDPARSLAKLVTALKLGAAVVVVDPIANAGAEVEPTVKKLHRIDPAIVKRDFEAAGLTFEAESDALKNPQDDHSLPILDPIVRHHSDQMMLRFRKK